MMTEKGKRVAYTLESKTEAVRLVQGEWMPVEVLRSRIDSHRSKIDAI